MMALPYNSKIDLTSLDNDDLFNYFSEYAGYDSTALNKPYGIRVGSKVLSSHDTHDLFLQFKAEVESMCENQT